MKSRLAQQTHNLLGVCTTVANLPPPLLLRPYGQLSCDLVPLIVFTPSGLSNLLSSSLNSGGMTNVLNYSVEFRLKYHANTLCTHNTICSCSWNTNAAMNYA